MSCLQNSESSQHIFKADTCSDATLPGWLSRDGVRPVRTHSDFVVTKELPLIDYPPERCDAVDAHDEAFHTATNDPRSIVIYADRSKSSTATGAAWVEWSVAECELYGVWDAFRALSLQFDEKITVFIDSMTVLKLIGQMFVDGWSPGHAGITGNEIADIAAKKALTGMGRVATAVDFGMRNNCLIHEIKEEEWLRCHIAEGHEYYTRKPGSSRHLKELSRMDQHILLTLRYGVMNRGHNCLNGGARFHLQHCSLFTCCPTGNLFDDKHLGNWVA
ncbi:hypothetical protein B9Z19DRAFT_1137088 [Tuber borchii]|uniref:RNase H type-1 domain-containing protein n=1 Tax=Tuber borchii TaxID=42251 RepID=A0A2T6ZAW4_TUBBO|nr:hypothetical protein B9Z19DRAFT_1137088 [Tuber borchii]